MVPLASLVTVSPTFGPEMVTRYNGFTAADINGGPAPASLGAGEAAMPSASLAETLPRGVKFEWTDLTYQKILAGNTGMGLPAQRAAGLPGAGRAVREPDAAAGGHPDRADVHPRPPWDPACG
jgi:hypothetical protein